VCTTAGPITPAVTAAQPAGRQLTILLEPVDAVTVTTLVDNVTDLLALDAGPARRPFIGDATRGSSPLFEGGWLYEGLVAEHGFSALVTHPRPSVTDTGCRRARVPVRLSPRWRLPARLPAVTSCGW